MTIRLASLLIALLAVAALAEKRPARLAAADVTPAGELAAATLRGTDRVVFSTRKGDVVSSEEVELAGVPESAQIVDVRLGRHGPGPFLALVLREGDGHTYRYATPAAPPEGPANPFPQLRRYQVSDAIFETTGEPYRVLSASSPGGDSIEIVFQRGWASADASGVKRGEGAEDVAARLDQRVYHNGCPVAGLSAGALWRVSGLQAAR